jgi:hypothetical protein
VERSTKPIIEKTMAIVESPQIRLDASSGKHHEIKNVHEQHIGLDDLLEHP